MDTQLTPQVGNHLNNLHEQPKKVYPSLPKTYAVFENFDACTKVCMGRTFVDNSEDDSIRVIFSTPKNLRYCQQCDKILIR